ncbi:hypothetical protein JAO29_14725 [Edaphobacter sp. HDX4]|uniref:hypothetical protein n=1 Tax=Edaphobacter sp. HDX4 TaxID=2794064 RepID=UPI002FE56514
MHQTLIIGSRIAAGIIGAFAFYMAFFLYEDERGLWQNRLENLWMAVYDRAKCTDSTATALFNKLGQILQGAFTWALGKRLFTFRSIIVSANLAWGCAFLMMSIKGVIFNEQNGEWVPSEHRLLMLILSIALLTFAMLPGIFRHALVTALCYLPMLCFLCVVGIEALVGYGTYAVLPIVLLWSVTSTLLTVAVLRKLFGSISTSVSIVRTLITIALLSAVLVLIAFSPYFIYAIFMTSLWDTKIGDSLINFGYLLQLMNAALILACGGSIIMLGVILLHKALWPILSRTIYSLAENTLVSNKKVLSSIGTLCITYAFNVSHVGIKEILKLFGYTSP